MAELHQATGNVFAALHLLDQALGVMKRGLGENHPSVFEMKLRIAMTHMQLSNPLEALKFFEEALAGTEKVRGASHIDCSKCLQMIGQVMCEFGDIGDAEAALNRALTITKETTLHQNQKSHPLIPEILLRLVTVHSKKGDFARALECGQEALTLVRTHKGEEHEEVGTVLHKLGVLHRMARNFEESEKLFKQALAVKRKAFKGKPHGDMTVIFNDLGELCVQQNKLDEALKHFQEALNVLRALGGVCPQSGQILNQMGFVLKGLGKIEQARAQFAQALVVFRQLFGDGHPLTQQTLHAMNSC